MLRNIALAIAAIAFSATAAMAASAKGYQVTGPVEEVTDSKIIIMKGSEKWEIARDASTQIPADIKKGDKVTVYYSMTATTVEPKAEKSASRAEKLSKQAPAAGKTSEKTKQ